jgi:hypothetical protein
MSFLSVQIDITYIFPKQLYRSMYTSTTIYTSLTHTLHSSTNVIFVIIFENYF